MITLDPKFTIVHYPPTSTAFGGVEFSFEESCSFQDLKGEVIDVIESIGDSLKWAYEIRTIIEQPQANILSTKVTPIKAELDNKAFVLNIREGNTEGLRTMRNVCKRMEREDRDNVILLRNNYENDSCDGLYFFHKLKKIFDPVSTGYLLEATKRFLFKFAGEKCISVKREIKPSYLKVDLEVDRPVNQLYI